MTVQTVARGWEEVAQVFADLLAEDGSGASLAVVLKGELVVDLWGGEDPLSGVPWRSDDVTLAFSAAKGLIGLLLADEIAQGTLDPDAPVSKYWPEFGSNGKDRITVREVFTHQAGVPQLGIASVDELLDLETLTETVAARPVQYEPGSARVYHVLTYGVIAAEVLRRVTGRTVDQLFEEKFAVPLGVDLWLGAPSSAEEHYRFGLMGPVEAPGALAGPAALDPACRASHAANSEITQVFERKGGQVGTEAFNDVAFREAVVPGGGLVTNARALARLYGSLVDRGELAPPISRKAIDLAARDWSEGAVDPACSGVGGEDRVQVPWGIGVELSNSTNPMLGPGSFGHAGMGGRLAFAHVPSEVGFAFVSQRMLFPEPGKDLRWVKILGAVRRALGMGDPGPSQ